jgi:hypothetical protein
MLHLRLECSPFLNRDYFLSIQNFMFYDKFPASKPTLNRAFLGSFTALIRHLHTEDGKK